MYVSPHPRLPPPFTKAKPEDALTPATTPTTARPAPLARLQDPAAGRAALLKLQPLLNQYVDCVSSHLKARPLARAAAVYTAAAKE